MSDHTTTVQISQLMESSGVKFGTSGARGLVSDMTDEVCYAYTVAFLQYLEKLGQLSPGDAVAIAYDYRPSSPRLMAACCQAISNCGYIPINGGQVPTPAIALYGIQHKHPSLMITGSHIPDDRNGIKFYRCDGEILKADEQAIKAETINFSDNMFDRQGMFLLDYAPPEENINVYQEYILRFTSLLPSTALEGMKVGVYQHSSVARRLIVEILEALGAKVIPLGYSETFIPVDTEAVRAEDIKLGCEWANTHRFDAIVSTDGDGDRPLIGDENGTWLRGDIVGILCAQYLHADIVVTPISSNTAVEKSGLFTQVLRTRIGSPFVIEAMQQAADYNGKTIVGYEANGGFLTQTDVTIYDKRLSPLPTRDAVLPILALLHLCAMKQVSVSELVKHLPSRFTYSDRIKGIPTVVSQKKIEELENGSVKKFIVEINNYYNQKTGEIQSMDTTDGLRVTLSSGDIIHLRSSGNAPELRCYTESNSIESAMKLNRACIGIMNRWE